MYKYIIAIRALEKHLNSDINKLKYLIPGVFICYM